MVGEEIEGYTLVQFVCFSDVTEHLKKAWVKRTGVAETSVTNEKAWVDEEDRCS